MKVEHDPIEIASSASQSLVTPPPRRGDMNITIQTGDDILVPLDQRPRRVATPLRRGLADSLHLSLSGEPEAAPPEPRKSPSSRPATAWEAMQDSVPREPQHRRPTMTWVSVFTTPMTTSLRPPNPRSMPFPDVNFRPREMTRLQPPNEMCLAGPLVSASTSMLLASSRPQASSEPAQVQLHIYDLSHGMLLKHSKQLLGKRVAGVYHSGIVCFGMEMYFEGGIAISAAGRTRFRKKFLVADLGKTTRSLSEFYEWLREMEVSDYQLSDYHPIRHNCHHFTRAAAEFLTGKTDRVPRFLFSTVNDLVKTEFGPAVRDVILLTTQGVQAVVSRHLKARVIERQVSYDVVLNSSNACGVNAIPPLAVTLFRIADRSRCAAAIDDLVPYVRSLVDSNVVRDTAPQLLQEVNNELVRGSDTIPAVHVSAYVRLVVESLLSAPPALWGPIFNSLRICLLHKQVLIEAVFDRTMVPLLFLAARDYPRLLPDGRLGLLRVMCNLSSAHHGALILNDPRFCSAWVALVGMSLKDSQPAMVYTGAALAVNLAISIVVTTAPSLRREVNGQWDAHPSMRLVTVILYNLRFRTAEQLPEAPLNMLLRALLVLVSANSILIDYSISHAFPLQHTKLLDRAGTSESRALVCILKTLQDLYGM